MASIPLGLLRSVHRHQNAAREVGTVVLSPARPHVIRGRHMPCAREPWAVPQPLTQPLLPPPRQVLALGSLFAVVAWRGPPAWFAGALAVAVVLLGVLSLLALAACRRARALDTAPNMVQGNHSQAAEACPVPVAFQPDDPGRVRLRSCWRGCSLYGLFPLAATTRRQRRSLLPHCFLLATLNGLEDTLVTTLVPWYCFELSPRGTSSTTRLLQAALASALCAAACRLGRAATRAILAACTRCGASRRRAGHNYPSSTAVSPIPPWLQSPARPPRSPVPAAAYQTPPGPSVGHSSPLPVLPLLPPAVLRAAAPRPLAARVVSLGGGLALAVAAAVLVPSAQELAARWLAHAASWPLTGELLLGLATLGAGALLEAAQQPHARRLLSRAGSTRELLAAAENERRGAAPQAAPLSLQHSVTQLTGSMQLLLGGVAQPVTCLALGLLPHGVGRWAAAAAFAALILAAHAWLWCCSSTANAPGDPAGASSPVDGPVNGLVDGPVNGGAYTERFDAAPVRRLELEPSGR